MYLFACENTSDFGSYNISIPKQDSCVYFSFIQLLVPNNLDPNWTSQRFYPDCQFPPPLPAFNQADNDWFKAPYTSASKQKAREARPPRSPIDRTAGLLALSFCRLFSLAIERLIYYFPCSRQ